MRWRPTLIACLLAGEAAAQSTIPRNALQYRRELTANAHFVWGLKAPIALFAGQIHQESGWRADAKSPYAGGLAQFTPDTSQWISTKYADELGDNQPYEPSWALRALARYDRFLYERNPGATECERWAFTLSAYNGGEGWLRRQQAATKAAKKDPARWFGHVENVRVRAQWAHDENRNYPRAILLRRMPIYLSWGVGVDCSGVR